MPEPMTDERREEIRAALEPLPAYPWKWRSGRDLVSGDYTATTLITSGHGSALLFHAADPASGDSLLLAARQFATEGLPNAVGHWVEHGAQYAEELLVENQRVARRLDEADSRLRVADERERAHLDRIAQLEEQLAARTERAIIAEHHAEGVDAALGRAKQDAGELEQLVADAYVEPAEPWIGGDRNRELAEYFVRQTAGSVDFQSLVDDLGQREEFQALDPAEFDESARAIHDLATRASVTVHLPKEV